MRRYVAIGAAVVALTYFLDPENGPRRRQAVRAWLNDAARRVRERMGPAPDDWPVEAGQSGRPSLREERLSRAEEPPARVEEPPARVEEPPARVEERPAARVEERPARVEERPASAEEPLLEPEPVAVGVAAAPEPEEAPRVVAVAERPFADATLPPPLPPDVLGTTPTPEPTIEEPVPPAPAPRKRRRGWLTGGTVLLVAALAAAGVGAWSFDLVGSSDDEPDSSAALAALTERQARAISIMAQPGATRLPVVGAEESLLLVVGVEGDAVLIVSRLKRAPSGKTYEIWVISGKTPRPAGLFRGGRDAVVPLTRVVPKGATVALTLERAGGSPRPTSQPMYAVTRS